MSAGHLGGTSGRPTWALRAALLTACMSGCSAVSRVAVDAKQRSSVPTRASVEGAETAAPDALEAEPERAGPEEEAAHDDSVDDAGEAVEPAAAEALVVPSHPLDDQSDAQIKDRVEHDLASLGSMSIGSPNAGGLLNGVQANENELYKPLSASGAWATQETLDYLAAALGKVRSAFPDTPPLALGDISGKHGGPWRPHVSHQSGRDVDIAYFYSDGSGWYARGTARNLDLARNWAFVRALITETDVDLILIDHSIQVLLEDYARAHGEDPAWLSGIFRGVPGKLRPIIRHAPGHATHLHIRFFNPIAQETARRCYPYLLRAKLTSAPESFIVHKVKKNETLGMISRKYGVPVPRLRAVNGLRSSLIRERSALRIPVAARGPAGPGPRLRLPARRLPPAPQPPVGGEGVAQPPPTR